MAANKTTVNKSDFVRNLPETMSLKNVVAKGESEGIKLSEQYVSRIRSLARAKAKKAKKGAVSRAQSGRAPAVRNTQPGAATESQAVAPTGAKRRGRPPSTRNAKPAAADGGLETQLVELVLDHGMRAIEQALGAIREKLRRSLV